MKVSSKVAMAGTIALEKDARVSAAEELQTAMLARLRASEAFSTGVGGRIFDAEPNEFPCAWVGVTGSIADDDDEAIDLLATVHIWKRSGQDAAVRLTEYAREAFLEPPPTDNLSIISWTPDHSEVRLDNDHLAFRGLVRFRARATSS